MMDKTSLYIQCVQKETQAEHNARLLGPFSNLKDT